MQSNTRSIPRSVEQSLLQMRFNTDPKFREALEGNGSNKNNLQELINSSIMPPPSNRFHNFKAVK